MPMTPIIPSTPLSGDQAATAVSKVKWHNKHVRLLSLIPGASIAIARKVFQQKSTQSTSSLGQDHNVQYIKSYSKPGAIVLAIPVIGNIFALFKIVGQGIGRALDTRAAEKLLKGLKGDPSKFDVSAYKNMTPAQFAFAWKELAQPKTAAALTQEDLLNNPSLKKLTEALIGAQPAEKKAEYVKQLLEHLKDVADKPVDKQLPKLIKWLADCSKLPKETIQMAVLQAKWTYVTEIPENVRWEFDKASSQPPESRDFVHALRYMAAYEDNPHLHMGFGEQCKAILRLSNIGQEIRDTGPNDPTPIIALQKAVKIQGENVFSEFFAAHGQALAETFFDTEEAVTAEKASQGIPEPQQTLDRIEFAGMLLRQCPGLSMGHRSYLLNEIAEDFAQLDLKHPTENQLHVLSQVLMEFNKFEPKELSLEAATLSEKLKGFFTKKPDRTSQVPPPSRARFKEFFEDASRFIENNQALLTDENDQKRVALLKHVNAKLFASKPGESAQVAPEQVAPEQEVSLSDKLDKLFSKVKKAAISLGGREQPVSREEFDRGKAAFLENIPKQASLLLNADAFHTWIQSNKQYLADSTVQTAVKQLVQQLPSEMQPDFLSKSITAAIKQSQEDMDQKTDAEQEQAMALVSFFSGLFAESAPEDMALTHLTALSRDLEQLEGEAALREFVSESDPQVKLSPIQRAKQALQARSEGIKAAKAEKIEQTEQGIAQAIKDITTSVPVITEIVREGLRGFDTREQGLLENFNTAADDTMMDYLYEKDIREDLQSCLTGAEYNALYQNADFKEAQTAITTALKFLPDRLKGKIAPEKIEEVQQEVRKVLENVLREMTSENMASLYTDEVRSILKRILTKEDFMSLYQNTPPEEVFKTVVKVMHSLEGKSLVTMRSALQEIGIRQTMTAINYTMSQHCIEFQRTYDTQMKTIDQIAATIATQKEIAIKARDTANAALQKQEKAKDRNPVALAAAQEAFDKARMRVDDLQEADDQIQVSKSLLKGYLTKTQSYSINLSDAAECFAFAKRTLTPERQTFFSAIDDPALDATIRASIARSSKAQLTQELTQLFSESVSKKPSAEKSPDQLYQSILKRPIKELPAVIASLQAAAEAQFETIDLESAEAVALDAHIENLENLLQIAKYGKPFADFINKLSETERKGPFYKQILSLPPEPLKTFIDDAVRKGQKAMEITVKAAQAHSVGVRATLEELQTRQVDLENVQQLLRQGQASQEQTLEAFMAVKKQKSPGLTSTYDALTSSLSDLKTFLTQNEKAARVFHFNKHFEKAYTQFAAHSLILSRKTQPLRNAIAQEKERRAVKTPEQQEHEELSASFAAHIAGAGAKVKVQTQAVDLPALEAQLAEFEASENALAQYRQKLDRLKDELQIVVMQPAIDEYSKINEDQQKKIEALITDIALAESEYHAKFRDYSPTLRFSTPAKQTLAPQSASFSEGMEPKTPTGEPQTARASTEPTKTSTTPTSTLKSFRERAAEKLRRKKG